MTQRRASRSHLLLFTLIILAVLAACSSQGDASRPTRVIPTLFPTTTAPSSPAGSPSATDAVGADSGWRSTDAGIELRHILVTPPDEREPFSVIVVRLDTQQVRLRVAYDQSQPRMLSSWFEQRRPVMAVNGGFFTESFAPTALLISDGVASGMSYQGFGGMLAVDANEHVSLWPLRDTPYDPAIPLVQGLQSFPMLVFPGGTPAPVEDNGQRARRTAVALDEGGRVLFIVSPTSGFTLRELAEWLATGDMDVDRALNLDGGSSTGLFLSAGELSEQIDSFGPLPIVILAEPRH